MPERCCDRPTGRGRLTELHCTSEAAASNTAFSLIPEHTQPQFFKTEKQRHEVCISLKVAKLFKRRCKLNPPDSLLILWRRLPSKLNSGAQSRVPGPSDRCGRQRAQAPHRPTTSISSDNKSAPKVSGCKRQSHKKTEQLRNCLSSWALRDGLFWRDRWERTGNQAPWSFLSYSKGMSKRLHIHKPCEVLPRKTLLARPRKPGDISTVKGCLPEAWELANLWLQQNYGDLTARDTGLEYFRNLPQSTWEASQQASSQQMQRPLSKNGKVFLEGRGWGVVFVVFFPLVIFLIFILKCWNPRMRSSPQQTLQFHSRVNDSLLFADT